MIALEIWGLVFSQMGSFRHLQAIECHKCVLQFRYHRSRVLHRHDVIVVVVLSRPVAVALATTSPAKPLTTEAMAHGSTSEKYYFAAQSYITTYALSLMSKFDCRAVFRTGSPVSSA